jgi:hypothetical protein
MSSAVNRLSKLAAHFLPSSSSLKVADAIDDVSGYRYHVHTLSPTFFLPRAATIEPDVRESFYFSETPLTCSTGTGDLPQNRKWQDLEEDISGNRGPSQGLRVLREKEGL